MSLEFEEQLKNAQLFIGRTVMVVNSSEIIINHILRSDGIEPKGSTWDRFNSFIKFAKKQDTDVDLAVLEKDLFDLNNLGNIVKHGNYVVGADQLTFTWNDEFYHFSEDEIKQYDTTFTNIQKRLMKIGNGKKGLVKK